MEGDMGWRSISGRNNNWDLNAVVRMGGGGIGVAPPPPNDNPFAALAPPSPPQPQAQEMLNNVVNWQMYPHLLLHPLVPVAVVEQPAPQPPPPQPWLPQSHGLVLPVQLAGQAASGSGGSSSRPKGKSRCNKANKTVIRVPADAPEAVDQWAWRKYGQKIIKGADSPRSYYRCTTNNECPARKNVDRCRTNPGILVVTYTGDHNHPAPRLRNVLSGTTRSSPQPPPSAGAPAEEATAASPASGPSPTPPLQLQSAEIKEDEQNNDAADAAVGVPLMKPADEPDAAGNSGVGVQDDVLFPMPEEATTWIGWTDDVGGAGTSRAWDYSHWMM
ncbi:hypothetical protein ACP4OV_013044 [Aristida adscensionis]